MTGVVLNKWIPYNIPKEGQCHAFLTTLKPSFGGYLGPHSGNDEDCRSRDTDALQGLRY